MRGAVLSGGLDNLLHDGLEDCSCVLNTYCLIEMIGRRC